MKYIKIFEGAAEFRIKQKFSDKINWKFYNYLIDKLTPLEDKGIPCNITIYIPGMRVNVKPNEGFDTKILYSYSTEYGGKYRSNNSSVDKLESYYERSGLAYSACVQGNHIDINNFVNSINFPDIKIKHHNNTVVIFRLK